MAKDYTIHLSDGAVDALRNFVGAEGLPDKYVSTLDVFKVWRAQYGKKSLDWRTFKQFLMDSGVDLTQPVGDQLSLSVCQIPDIDPSEWGISTNQPIFYVYAEVRTESDVKTNYAVRWSGKYDDVIFPYSEGLTISGLLDLIIAAYDEEPFYTVSEYTKGYSTGPVVITTSFIIASDINPGMSDQYLPLDGAVQCDALQFLACYSVDYPEANDGE